MTIIFCWLLWLDQWVHAEADSSSMQFHWWKTTISVPLILLVQGNFVVKANNSWKIQKYTSYVLDLSLPNGNRVGFGMFSKRLKSSLINTVTFSQFMEILSIFHRIPGYMDIFSRKGPNFMKKMPDLSWKWVIYH